MDIQLKRGLLDVCVLATIKSEESHGYKIMKEIKPYMALSESTLYTISIVFALLDNKTCRIECYEEEKAGHLVTVEKGTLTVTVVNEKSWYDSIGFHFVTPKITVLLPKTAYAALFMDGGRGGITLADDFQFESVSVSIRTGSVYCAASASGMVQIQTSTGEVRVENGSAGALDFSAPTDSIWGSNMDCQGVLSLHVTTGKTTLTDTVCKNLTSTGVTGELSLTQVIAEETMSLQRSTGSVRLDGVDAAEIQVQTDTGDVSGTLLSEKIFFAESSTGSIDVPQSQSGGTCQITTETGSIRLDVQ